MFRIGESEVGGGVGGGREDQATQTDEDEADMEPPRRLQRPTHFQSGTRSHTKYRRKVNLVLLYIKVTSTYLHVCF